MLSGVYAVVARDEIRQLAYRYAWALDCRDIDGLVALFVDDVRVAPDTSGLAALRAAFVDQLSGLGPTVLFVGNHIIDFDGRDEDRATGIVYCRGFIQAPGAFIEQMIVYTDRYRRGSQWQFMSRRHELVYGVPTAEQPFDQPPANWPEHHDGLGTVPERFETWRAFWS